MDPRGWISELGGIVISLVILPSPIYVYVYQYWLKWEAYLILYTHLWKSKYFFLYRNEEDVGSAVRKSGIPREEIFITTKAKTKYNSHTCKYITCVQTSVSRNLDTNVYVPPIISAGVEFISRKREHHQVIEEKFETVRDSQCIVYSLFNIELYIHIYRMGMDYIDLYLMHSPLGGKVVETWQTMVQLQQQGLIKWVSKLSMWLWLCTCVIIYIRTRRSIGVSNFNVHHLEGLKKVCPDHIPAGRICTYPAL